jgi:hypothetical protein
VFGSQEARAVLQADLELQRLDALGPRFLEIEDELRASDEEINALLDEMALIQSRMSELRNERAKLKGGEL